MKTVIEMAREAGFEKGKLGHLQWWSCGDKELERFAALVREDEREKQNTGESNDASTMENVEQSRMGSSTKNDIEAAVLQERKANAKRCEELGFDPEAEARCAAAIRARDEK